ncbi:MAG: maltose alpha-D-glucosyltransferase, partial [Chitinophagaceae bacterium]
MNDNKSNSDKNLLWYKDAIIYELHIKAFCDSNGDGTGDFAGLMTKLDYLQDLGVTAIWVLPFYPSPQKDDGYDIADYYSINSRYGTIEQFQQFLTEAHKRNLKVITELVINHTSDQHPWFQKARHASKGSPERDFYVWSDSPDKYKDVRIIFGDFEASNWSWDPVAQQYFWHRFFHHQPDLNFDNEQVQQEIFKILDFWCAMGVDGFRLDAVPYLFEREGTNGENLPETHAFLKRLRSHVDAHFPGIVFLAEANMWPEDSASYFGDGDECHMNYHFPVMPRMFMALEQEDRYPITDIFDQTPAIPESCQWALFLRNHDELTLEMVTDEERDFMYKVYAKDPKARINLGIRHRLAPLMDNDRKRIELMNALLFSLPGTPVVYYGDEIGMGDNFYLGDRDGVRTPMQWSPDRNAGFSSANPHQLYLPVILDPEYSYQAVNVELQRQNTSSLFWFMKRIINMRRNYPAFSRGSMQFIQVENPKVLAFTRSYKDEHLLVIVNLSKHAQPAEVDMKEFKGYVPVEAFSKNAFPIISSEQPYFFTLSAHSFQWFILQKISQSDLDPSLPFLEIDHWSSLQEHSRALKKNVLPAYLKRSKWFKGRD